MFSFGIVLCEILARIPADPEILPRTQVNINSIIEAIECHIQYQNPVSTFIFFFNQIYHPCMHLILCVAGLWPGCVGIQENGQRVSSASFGAGSQLLSGK